MKHGVATLTGAVVVAFALHGVACTGSDPDAVSSRPDAACAPGETGCVDGSSTINGDPAVPDSSGGDPDSGPDAAADADANGDANGDADADAGPWTPAALPGLVTWLDASKGVTLTSGNVTRWADQSPKGTDFTVGSNGPTVIVNAIAGLDALSFSTTGLTAAPPNAFNWGSSDFVIAVVAKPLSCSIPQPCAWWVATDPSGEVIRFQGAPSAQISAHAYLGGAGGESPDFASGVWRVFAAHRIGSKGEVRVDGVATTNNNSVTTTSIDQETATIGTGAGQIAEIVAAKNVTAADVLTLETYLKTKYGL